MAEFLEKYATATHCYLPMVKRGVVDFAVSADWTPAAGDVKVSIDGAAAANITTLPVAVTMGNTAYWDFALSSAETTGKKIVVTVGDSATKAVEDQSFLVKTFGNASAFFIADLSLANLPANAVQINGVATASVTTVNANVGTTQAITFDANNLPKVDIEDIVGAAVNVNAAQLGVKMVSTAANAITSSSLATNTITSGNVAASFFNQFMTRYNATAQAGAASTITLDSGASATDHLYEGEVIVITSGAGAGQSRVITGYVGSTKVATVDTAWTTNPDNTSVFNILANRSAKLDSSLQVTAASVQGNVTGSVGSVTGAVGSVTGAVGSVTGNVGGNVVGSVGSVATGVTVTTNNDKTGYSLTQSFPANFAAMAITAGGIVSANSTQIGGTAQTGLDLGGTWTAARAAHLDADISSRMATYTQPTGFLAATFPTTVASPTNITAATGVSLAATGLDAIAVTDPGAPSSMTTIPKLIVGIWRSIFKKSTLTATQLKTYADDGTSVNSTATVSDDGTTQTKGAAS